MYFQHHSGQIRSAQLGSDGNWKGGDATEIVAVDAKNGTPIAAVAYSRNNTAVVSIWFATFRAFPYADRCTVAYILHQLP